MNQEVLLSKGAAEDISRLAAGTPRAEVALNALEEPLNPSQVERLKKLLARYTDQPQAPAVDPATVQGQRAQLIKDFGIEVVGEGKVRLSLNETSRIHFLRKVQEVVSNLRETGFGSYDRPAIYAPRLEEWASDEAFTVKASKGCEIAVDGNVHNSTRKRRDEQEAKGWNNVDLSDLAVAHAAYLLVTEGKDLFGGNVVRARGGALRFYADGLCVGGAHDDFRVDFVAASAALPPRN